MALRVRYRGPAAGSYSFSVERLADGLLHDFADGTFKAAPATLLAPLAEGSGAFLGVYRATVATTLQIDWPDGQYVVGIHQTASPFAIQALADAIMFAGDDAPAPPSAVTAAEGLAVNVTQWAGFAVPPAVVAGVPRVDLHHVLGASPVPQAGPFPATLVAAGLDAVVVEPGINARQALAAIGAACAGLASGLGTPTAIFYAMGTLGEPRLTATTTTVGDRTAVVLNLPV